MIPGITDTKRLPRLGKIRLGEKAVSKKGVEYPKALDHFSFIDAPEVEKVYGKKCSELSVLLPADDEETWFPTSRSAYRKSGLFCKCSDGETATRVYVEKDEQGAAYIKETGLAVEEGEMFELPCPGDDCPYWQEKNCKNLGRLQVMLPEVPGFGVWEIATTGKNSMLNVFSVSRPIQRYLGTVVGVPFALSLKPMEVQVKGKATKIHALFLDFRGSIKQLAMMGRELKSGGALALLAPASDEVPDDLYPQAGERLEKKLDDQPAVAMPRRASEKKKAPEPEDEPEPIEAEVIIEPEEEPEPELPPEDTDAPYWRGRVADVEMKDGETKGRKWKLFTIIGHDGKRFQSFDEKFANFAREAFKKKKNIAITYEKTPRGGQKITEIRFG